jgi:YHS domain-containing protein
MEVAVTPDALGLEIAGERFFFCSSACREAYATERAAD